jgi:transcriptional regulator with XRE-family HTH domain
VTHHTLGSRLRKARLDANLSQSALEALTGIPKARLSRYEHDHVAPSIATLRKLVLALDADVAWLIGV